jgi:hypothetical protein
VKKLASSRTWNNAAEYRKSTRSSASISPSARISASTFLSISSSASAVRPGVLAVPTESRKITPAAMASSSTPPQPISGTSSGQGQRLRGGASSQGS